MSKFVFSSSATVYWDNKVPFVETMEILPTTNSYGETKAMRENFNWYSKSKSGLLSINPKIF